jgi:transcriptional regulator with XRE-family HTH domain
MEALRDTAGLTQQQVALKLDKGRATIARIEDGEDGVRLRALDVEAMLKLYGAGEEDSELLLALAAETRNGRSKSWWHDRTETELPGFFGLYVMLEDSAERIRQVEIELVPGLLQTRSYAEQVHRVPLGYVDEDESRQRVDVRIERQSLLTRGRAPRLDVILNEAVFHRTVGGTEVMVEQLERLLEVGQWGNISVRVLPFSAGLHAGMAACTPFTILDFPRNEISGEPLEPSLAYVDALTGALYLNKPDEFRAYELTWDDIQGRALDEAASREMIETTLEGLHRG